MFPGCLIGIKSIKDLEDRPVLEKTRVIQYTPTVLPNRDFQKSTVHVASEI